VNAVIEDWPADGAERRALREWETRHGDRADAADSPPSGGGDEYGSR
jgi:hypothetical protein